MFEFIAETLNTIAIWIAYHHFNLRYDPIIKTAPNTNGNHSLATPVSLIDAPTINPAPSPNPV